MKKKTTLCLTVTLVVSMLLGCAGKTNSTQIPIPQATSAEPEASGTTSAAEFTVVTVNSVEPDKDAFVLVNDYIPDIEIDLHYATVNNFARQRIYDFTDAYLRYGTVIKLKAASDILKTHGYGLKIWDAFRPVYAQAKLYEAYPDPNVVSHPVTGYRGHCRGNAVDLTLIDLATGQELPMPTGFDNFTAYADRDYSDCGTTSATNAKLLEQVMTECGFKPLQSEWWHFTDTDTYPVDEFFEPGTPGVWEANCNEYISLRKTAGSSEVLAKIPAGARVSLQNWDGRYAKVSYDGQEGYVLCSYIKPEDQLYFASVLSTVPLNNVYQRGF